MLAFADMFDPRVLAAVPFHFWSVTLFVFGTMVGSFLNVCIHRLPRGESIVSPPSHCPHCRYSIPWYLNVPLVTWLWLRGRCAHCGAPIAVRYFLVELLTGVAFLACWVGFGHDSAGVALVYCLVLAGFIAATFIDLEHFIIPDEITLGGIVVGFLCSVVVPLLHHTANPVVAMKASALGIAVGGGILYAVVRLGKLFFGRHKIALPPDSTVIFTETALRLPDMEVPYEEIFYRKSDTVRIEAKRVELVDRCYRDVLVRLRPDELRVGDEVINPEEVSYLEAVTDRLVLPREAMGLGDVKFMAAIGAFLGWPATLFSLFFSAVLGSIVGLTLIALKRREASGRIPYGPYIAAAATVWIFFRQPILGWVVAW